LTSKVKLYEHIINDLLQDIETGKLKAGDKIPTEAELGEKYQVSRITVTRALKDLEYRGLLTRIKKKGSFIREPEKSTYPQQSAASIPAIAVILPYDEEFGYNILRGVEQVCTREGVYVTFHNTKFDAGREREILEKVLEDNLIGAIIYPSDSKKNIDIYSKLIIRKFPFVLIDRTIEGLQVPHVVSNNMQAGYDLTMHLIGLGHKRIAFVCTALNEVVTVADRYRGYCNALIESGIAPQAEWLIEDQVRIEKKNNGESDERLLINQQRLERLLQLPDRPTAVVAVNDETAMQLIKTAQQAGFSVPDQLSVAGFDNLVQGEMFDVPLTTISQDFTAMGEKGADVVMQLRRATEVQYEIAPTVTLGTELVVRKSTASL